MHWSDTDAHQAMVQQANNRSFAFDDVCCNGNCSQAHECPRYRQKEEADSVGTLVWQATLGVAVLALLGAAYLSWVA